MPFDQSQSVSSDRQLSEKYQTVTEAISDLESRLSSLREIVKQLNQRKEEYVTLRQRFEQLANLNRSSPIGHAKGLRDVDGKPAFGNAVTVPQNSMSWDFEGLTVKEHRPPGDLESDAEMLENVIANVERELTEKKIERELLAKEREGRTDYENNVQDERRLSDNTEMLAVLEKGIEKQCTLTSGEEYKNKIHELENYVDLQTRRIEELLEKNQEMQNDVNVLKKQKDELLKVNHQWDEQYRLLKEDKERALSELRKKVQTQTVTDVKLRGQNPESSQEYSNQIAAELTQKNEALSQEVARLLEKQAKTDSLWLSAKKMITEEREARAAAAQQTQTMQQRYQELEHELQIEKQTQVYLKKEIERLVSGADRGSSGLSLSPDVTEQIEMLKQQIRVYADDFANERSDRERIQADREEQKELLKAHQDEIALLKEQVRIYQDDFNRERNEKERFQRQIRDRRPVTVAQPEEPWYVTPPNDYNPVQRRQAYLERTYRGQPPYTPREIQELAYYQQQHLQARGNNVGHPGGLCHGCEADSDVIDGTSAQGTLNCPRCDRKFPGKERRAFDEHIDKCTT